MIDQKDRCSVNQSVDKKLEPLMNRVASLETLVISNGNFCPFCAMCMKKANFLGNLVTDKKLRYPAKRDDQHFFF